MGEASEPQRASFGGGSHRERAVNLAKCVLEVGNEKETRWTEARGGPGDGGAAEPTDRPFPNPQPQPLCPLTKSSRHHLYSHGIPDYLDTRHGPLQSSSYYTLEEVGLTIPVRPPRVINLTHD